MVGLCQQVLNQERHLVLYACLIEHPVDWKIKINELILNKEEQ